MLSTPRAPYGSRRGWKTITAMVDPETVDAFLETGTRLGFTTKGDAAAAAIREWIAAHQPSQRKGERRGTVAEDRRQDSAA